mgnify:CR=1 FL=1|tara:strand:- start:573 stop:1112 length:540 start_codon:yes stop_codon:yes gene_type:complete
MKKIKSVLLNEKEISKAMLRLSHEIVENFSDLDSIGIIGIRTRGEPLAKRIVNNIKKLYKKEINFGTLDVTFYRDDFSTNLGSPEVGPSEINFDINKKNIILIDDVLYTGRTIRAALDELFSYGRPSKVKLGVLVDRGHRELPIKADFIGKNYPTAAHEHIHVLLKETDNIEEVNIVEY